ERILGSAWPQTYNKPMAERMQRNMEAVGMPAWSEADIALAKAVQREVGRDTVGLPTAVDSLREADQGMGGGSDDIAEVSWKVPTVRLRYAANIPGTVGHHWSSAIAMATPIAHKGANHASRIVAMTAIDLLTDRRLLEEATRYHREVQTKDRQWISLIPAGTPAPAQLNADKMAQYRPRLETLRYDPSRYATYLEQLGITYPTIREGTDGGSR
ncbi:MAG: amidohydrolase, partial [Gemmatimonadota bacterium]|nr:amidohydrolase [Gemmatimonadota bacterium]